jgi:hypothetical protein
VNNISPRPFSSAVVGRPGNAARGIQPNKEQSKMNNEQPETEAEPKKPGDLTDSIPPADEPIDPKSPKLVRGGPVWQSEPDSVGMARHGGVIQAWLIQDGAGVLVFAKQMFEDGKYIDCWNVTATIDCEKAIIATVFGGRNRMNAIARFLRNGLISSRMSARHKRMNRQAKAADAAPSTKHEAPSTKHEQEAQS